MNKEIDLSVSCYGSVKDLSYDVAILPWGATEPHNYHLPYLTDCILSHRTSVDAAEKVFRESGVRCMVLPPVTYGSQNPGQRDYPFCLHARYETQRAILGDVVAALHLQGIRKLIIVNGHGGNSFKNMIRDLSVDFPDFLIAITNWYGIVPQEGYFENKDDHAGELETSVMMYYHPELVNLDEAGEGTSKPFALSSLNAQIAWLPRYWSKVSADTGIGDPRKSTPEKGERYAKAVIEKLALLFTEIGSKEVYL
jgi:creatinine amidohydrolase